MNESVGVEAGRDNLSFGLTAPRCSDPEYYNSLYGLIGTLFQVYQILRHTDTHLVSDERFLGGSVWKPDGGGDGARHEVLAHHHQLLPRLPRPRRPHHPRQLSSPGGENIDKLPHHICLIS